MTFMLVASLILSVTAVMSVPNITQTSATKSSGQGLNQLPSDVTDYPNDDPNAVEVHVTTANKDSIGNYHVRGEIKNLGEEILQYVKVTAHFYNAENQTVGVTSCCYTTPTDIDPKHTATFDSFAQENEMAGDATDFRLSYEWD
jgi:hypothetical protein